jgi:polyvinyl alcohol dehydrogenase (cytochrome)
MSAGVAVPCLASNVPGDQTGELVYRKNCASCHENPDVRAPELSALQAMSPQQMLFTLSRGKMSEQASALSDDERMLVVQYLTVDTGSTADWEQAMACESSSAPIDGLSMKVGGWGYTTDNRRYQPPELAGLTGADLPKLELAWAQGFPGATEMRSQPVVTADTVYVGVGSTLSVYAFDLDSGCLRWVHRGEAPIRSALAYGRLPNGGGPILYYGTGGGSVQVLNALDGSSLWSRSVKLDPTSIVTGTPVQYGSKLYVPVSNFDVARARDPAYECCKGRGGVVALDVISGETIWTYHTTPPARATGEKSGIGTALWGPSGAPVWTTPAIDGKRKLLYIGTGENYSRPTTDTSDAIIALDLDSGKPAWIFQATADDAYNMACSSWMKGKDGPNCPENSGPDFDFGASVIIARDKQGKDILLAGQKSGDVWALDPDNDGKVLWRTTLSNGTPVGGVHWGMSVIGDTVYVPISDPEWPIIGWKYKAKPGVSALDVSTGEVKWQYHTNRGCNLDPAGFLNGRHKEIWPECHFLYGFSGAATGLDDVVFAGALNGQLHAFAPEDGSVLWSYDTKRPFETLNGVEAHGGALDNAGYAIGGGHLVVQSGYSYIGQMPGNVLLVFRVPGKEK